jgi:hypothetical protein
MCPGLVTSVNQLSVKNRTNTLDIRNPATPGLVASDGWFVQVIVEDNWFTKVTSPPKRKNLRFFVDYIVYFLWIESLQMPCEDCGERCYLPAGRQVWQCQQKANMALEDIASNAVDPQL